MEKKKYYGEIRIDGMNVPLLDRPESNCGIRIESIESHPYGLSLFLDNDTQYTLFINDDGLELDKY